MNLKNKIDKPENEAQIKRNRDELKVVIAGIAVYAVVLLVIVIATFLLVRNIVTTNDRQVEREVSEYVKSNSKKLEEVKSDYINESPDSVRQDEIEEECEIEEFDIDHSVDIAKCLDDEGRLDYTKLVFSPYPRDINLHWKDLVFSKLENVQNPGNAPVNNYILERKEVALSDGINQDLFIYRNPEDNEIEKIKAVKCSEPRVIADYYYYKGNINYVDEYSIYIDVPIDISSGKVSSRYYFANDTLVKYSFCENNKATVFSVKDIGSYSDGTASQYDQLEIDMINRAYITYNAAVSLEERQYVEGYIQDEYDQPLKEVAITVTAEDSDEVVAEALTNDDGHYVLSMPVDDSKMFVLKAHKDSLDDVSIYGLTARKGSGTYFVETPKLTYYDDGAEYEAQIYVKDAKDGYSPIQGATIKLWKNLNCHGGEVVANGTLDDSGAAFFTLQAGNYTAEITKDGYETSYFNVILNLNSLVSVGYSVSDITAENEYKVVLAYQNENIDINGLAITSGGVDLIKSDYSIDGPYASECLTFDINNDCSYFVYDYSDNILGDTSSRNLSISKTKVYVYGSEGFVTGFSAPDGHIGTVWQAFAMRNSRIIPVNYYYCSIDSDSYWTE